MKKELKFRKKTDGSYEVVGCAKRVENVIIPTTYCRKSITSIGWGAFHECINLKSVKIPDGLTSIGNSAFGGCCFLTFNNKGDEEMIDEKEKRALKEFTKFLIDRSSEDGTLNVIDLPELLFEFTENTSNNGDFTEAIQ